MREIYIGSGIKALTSRVRGRVTRAEAPPLLALDRVDAFYGKSHIVKQATLAVHEREIVALLGRNGAGKSTLLKTIIGTVRVAAGAISLAGTALAGREAWQIARDGVGYVPQGRALFAGMSVRDNLALGRLKRGRGEGVAWSDLKVA